MSRLRHKACGGKLTGESAGGDVKEHKRGGEIHHHAEGSSAKKRADTTSPRKQGGGKWIQGAIKHPGALHKALHVPEGNKIPAAKLAKAAHSSNPTMRKRANLAKTLKGLH
jgi:hypothetical protein